MNKINAGTLKLMEKRRNLNKENKKDAPEYIELNKKIRGEIREHKNAD